MHRPTPRIRRETRPSRLIERMWNESPEERGNLWRYTERLTAYANDCGCSLGGAFMVSATVGVAIYALCFDGLRHATFTDWLLAVALIMVVTLTGKGIGIGIARLRLRLLYREIRTKYHAGGQ